LRYDGGILEVVTFDVLDHEASERCAEVLRLIAASSKARYWRKDHLLILLATDISIAITQQYGARLSERWSRR
jgi:hypothetical protein